MGSRTRGVDGDNEADNHNASLTWPDGHPPWPEDDDNDYNPTYMFSDFTEVEDLENYAPGGFHLVVIGDVFDKGRYEAVHKLGFGGFSTVWRGRDLHEHKYVALKMIEARKSDAPKDMQMLQQIESLKRGSPDDRRWNFLESSSARFKVEGPNGKRLCLVLPLLGPTIAELSSSFVADRKIALRPRTARKLALQLL